MKLLLDTNICIYLIKKSPRRKKEINVSQKKPDLTDTDKLPSK